jgi:hypothetical protein
MACPAQGRCAASSPTLVTLTRTFHHRTVRSVFARITLRRFPLMPDLRLVRVVMDPPRWLRCLHACRLPPRRAAYPGSTFAAFLAYVRICVESLAGDTAISAAFLAIS